MGFSRRDFPLMCCICFEGLSSFDCVVDTDGDKWDCCKGICAVEAGIEEKVYEDEDIHGPSGSSMH